MLHAVVPLLPCPMGFAPGAAGRVFVNSSRNVVPRRAPCPNAHAGLHGERQGGHALPAHAPAGSPVFSQGPGAGNGIGVLHRASMAEGRGGKRWGEIVVRQRDPSPPNWGFAFPCRGLSPPSVGPPQPVPLTKSHTHTRLLPMRETHVTQRAPARPRAGAHPRPVADHGPPDVCGAGQPVCGPAGGRAAELAEHRPRGAARHGRGRGLGCHLRRGGADAGPGAREPGRRGGQGTAGLGGRLPEHAPGRRRAGPRRLGVRVPGAAGPWGAALGRGVCRRQRRRRRRHRPHQGRGMGGRVPVGGHRRRRGRTGTVSQAGRDARR